MRKIGLEEVGTGWFCRGRVQCTVYSVQFTVWYLLGAKERLNQGTKFYLTYKNTGKYKNYFLYIQHQDFHSILSKKKRLSC